MYFRKNLQNDGQMLSHHLNVGWQGLEGFAETPGIDSFQSLVVFPAVPNPSCVATIGAIAIVCSSIIAPTAVADDATDSKPVIKHQITGLFSKDREPDLQEVFEKLAEFKLLKIDFENAEASFEYDPAKAFPGARPEQIVERFDNLLRNSSNHTFGVKPLRTIDRDKLKRIEIPVVGLDCKACSLGAYDAVYRLKGVECATASFKEGKVTALVDPAQIDQTELEMALKQRGVQIKSHSD